MPSSLRTGNIWLRIGSNNLSFGNVNRNTISINERKLLTGVLTINPLTKSLLCVG
jgi:hypothetical protein